MKKVGVNYEATAYNRAYLATVLRTFAQIQPIGWTSDTLGTLYEMRHIKNLPEHPARDFKAFIKG
ncbi:MAG: hypothetical protein U9O85_03740 [Euryarchaeota archaeon]|nr:hypothetical protein [Euryarchaeota archaeon]